MIFASRTAKTQNLDEHTKSVLENSLKKTFAPEFLNRLDDVILFNNLSKSDIEIIIEIELKKLKERVKDLNYTLKLTKKAKAHIAQKGFDNLDDTWVPCSQPECIFVLHQQAPRPLHRFNFRKRTAHDISPG